MRFFGSFRCGGLFDGVADSFRDALKTFTLFPEVDVDVVPVYDEEKRTVADAFKDVNQIFATILNNARQTGSIKPKNGQR